jgi:hypothetical protein
LEDAGVVVADGEAHGEAGFVVGDADIPQRRKWNREP